MGQSFGGGIQKRIKNKTLRLRRVVWECRDKIKAALYVYSPSALPKPGEEKMEMLGTQMFCDIPPFTPETTLWQCIILS